MIKKEVEIDGRKVAFRASAAIPRLYRGKFKRDIFKDLVEISKSIKRNNEHKSEIPIENLEMFENVAYLMAKHADPSQPETVEEWLEQFGTFSIYTIFPEIMELWDANLYTEAESKKQRKSSRQITTPIFLLRTVQLGISIRDMDLLTIGLIMDMWTENSNDNENYPELATQTDFDKF